MRPTGKILLLTSALLVLVLAASCGGQPEASPQEAEPSAQQAEVDTEAEAETVDAAAEDTSTGTESQPEEAAPPPAADGEALLNERCSTCHSTDRVTSASKTVDEWVSTIDRMISKGAELSEAERDILAAYLAETAGQ